MGDKATREKKFGFGSTRSWVVGTLAAVALLFGAPVAAQAAEGLSDVNTNNTTINGKTVDFGVTGQSGLPVTRTIYLWSNAASGGIFNSSTRNIDVDVRLNDSDYERSGGTCGTQTPDSGWTFRARLSFSGGASFRSCTIILRLKAGTSPASQNTTLNFQQRNTGWGSGSTTSGTATITGAVTKDNAPSVTITGPEGETGSFDFGEIGVGAFLGRPFTIENRGTTAINGDPVLTGTSSYSIVSEDCPNPIPINSSCTVSVRYTPTGEDGIENGQLSISGGGASATIAFTGFGSVPTGVLEVDQTSWDFGDSSPGFPITKEFTFTNAGNTRQELAFAVGVGTDPAVFYNTGTGTCGQFLAVGLSCTYVVAFDPAAAGPAEQAGSFTVTGSNPLVPDATQTVTLTGLRVAAAPSFEVRNTAGSSGLSTYGFGNVNVGSSGSYTFRIVNTGNTAFSLGSGSRTISGRNSGQFSVSDNGQCATIPRNGSSCTVTVNFAPTGRTGFREAALDVGPTNAVAQPQARTVSLTGEAGGLVIRNDQSDNYTVEHSTKRWLDTVSVGGAAATGDRVRAAFVVDLGPSQTVEDVLVSNDSRTDDNAPSAGSFNPVPSGIGRVEVQRAPGSSQALVIVEVPMTSVFGTSPGAFGMSGGFLDLCIGPTFKTNNRRVSFRLRGADGTLSSIVTSRVRYGNVSGLCSSGIPIPYEQKIAEIGGEPVANGNMNQVVGRNQSVKFEFKGFAEGNWTGINWRIRNANSGAMFTRTSAGGWATCASPCVSDGLFSTGNGSRIEYGNQPSGSDLSLTVPNWPSRGRWIVEGSGRGSGQDLNYPVQIGAVLVNDNGPQINVTGLPPQRPDTNSNWTLSATVSDPSDTTSTFNPQAGVGQTIEWDLNNDQTDGRGGDGFEVRADGDSSSGIDAADLTKAFTTAGKTPGPYTIRARVTDNGAILSNDGAGRSETFSRTFTINSLPQAVTENFDLEADDAQGSKVEFRADDVDSDPYKVTVTPSGGNNGELGNLTTAIGDTEIPYTWPADYTGNDQFAFFAEDDKKGVGSAGTLTVRVRPNTEIDEADPVGVNPVADSDFLGATRETEASFEFSSPQSPVVEYECRLTNDGEIVENWTECADGSTGDTSYDGLEDGLHKFEVRAVNDEGVADGTPAAKTWRVDNTAPVAVLKDTPRSDQPDVQPRPTNDDTPSYSFEADDRSPQQFVTYECRVLFGPESGNWKSCGSPVSEEGSSLVDLVGGSPDFGQENPLADGVYEIEVRATDDVGIQGAATPERVRIDTAPPTTSIATGPDGLINTRNVEFQATSTEAGSTFACELVGVQQGEVFEDARCPGQGAGGSVPTFQGLADDEYELRITAIDPATNRDTVPPVAEFEVDATEPTTDLNTVNFGEGPTGDRLTQSRRVTVGFQGEDPRTTTSSRLRGFQCRLDSDRDEDWNTCQSPESYGGLRDGEHVLEIRALDDAGNSDSTPQVIEWAVDRTPPTTTITDGPDPVSNDDRPEITFETNETADSECQLDGGPWVACDSPLDASVLNAGQALTDGPHTVAIRSTDGAGNLELTAASIAWEQDTVEPQVAMLGQPPAFTPLGSVDFGWSVKDGNPPVLSPEAASQCAFDPEDSGDIQEAEWEDCDRTYTVSEQANSNGGHSFFLRAVDQAGNMSEMVERSWTVLGTKPVEPSIDNSIPADGTTTRLNTASITFSHPLEGDESFDGLFCQLDGGPEFRCQDQYTAEGLGDGEHSFRIVARDTVGNESDPVTIAWTVQSRAPVTAINSGPSGLTRQTGATITFSSDKAGTFECRVDGAAWAACSSPLDLAGLADGPHSVRVRAVSSVQPVGVKDPTPPVRQWTVDATPPEVEIDSAPSGTIFNNAQASVTFSTDDQTASFQCKFGDSPFQACASPLNVSGRPNGQVEFQVRAVDPAGNLSEVAEAGWFVASPPPEVCPDGFEGTPPDCTPIPPPTSDAFEATLTGGSVSLGGLGDAEIPGGDLKLIGQLASDGTWTVPQNGVRFNAIEQVIPDALGPGLNAEVKILIQATGPGTGRLQPGGGSASFVLPVQARLAAGLNGNPLLDFDADCALRPVSFDLAGTYDEAGKKVSLSSPSVSFPQVSAGCGGLGGTINNLLELPRSDIAVTLNFDVKQVVDVTPARLATPRVTAPRQARSGKSITLGTQLRNTGQTAATGVRVCLKSPTSLVKGSANRCTTTSIAAGGTRTVSFRVATKRGKRGRASFQISAEYTSAGKKVTTRTGHVTLMK